MKNKTANELLKIIKYLVSSDEEIVLVGIALFKNSFIIQNIPKNKKFTLPNGWEISPPEGYYRKRTDSNDSFTKAKFIRMLDSQTLNYKVKVMYIFNLLNKITSGCHFSKRYRNYKLCYEVIHNLDNIPKEITSEKRHRLPYCTKRELYLRIRRDDLFSKKDTHCSEFARELFSLGINLIDIPGSSINVLLRYCKKSIGEQYLSSHQKYKFLRFLKSSDLDYLHCKSLLSGIREPSDLKFFKH